MMAVVDDRKVRFVLTRLSQQHQQQPQQLPATPPPPKGPAAVATSSTINTMGSGGRGVVHGTSQYVNGTLVTYTEEAAAETKVPSNGHGLTTPQSNFTAKRSNSACQILFKKSETKPIPVEQPPPAQKASIMKKYSHTTTIHHPIASPVRTNREPFEVRKLVTFTDLVEYEDQSVGHHLKGVHSEEDLLKLRLYNPTASEKAARTKIVSRNKMISSTSSPDMKSFDKLKGIKNVGGHYNPPMATKSFRIIPDAGLPAFKDLFDNNNAKCCLKSTATSIKGKAKCEIASLPVINIALIPNNMPASSNPLKASHPQDPMYLKVPKLRGRLLNNSSSGKCGFDFDDNSNSFKVFDRTLADGSLESFYGHHDKDQGDEDLPSLDMDEQTVIDDEVNLMQFWDGVDQWQRIHREQRLASHRIGSDNVLYLNNLRNELLMEGRTNG